MGLENSIKVQRNEYTNSITELQQFNLDWDDEHAYNFEVCYWRKCWGLRHDILHIIGKQSNQWSDEYKFNLTKDDITNIIELLKSYNYKTWENSIWSWDEYKKHIKRNIKNLNKLKKLMKKYDLEVYFYDSY